MRISLLLAETTSQGREEDPFALTPAQALLRKLVLDSVPSVDSRRNYARALDDLFKFAAGRPLTRGLLQEWKAGMDALSPSTINVRLSAACKLVAEARKNGLLSCEDAQNLTDILNVRQKATRWGTG